MKKVKPPKSVKQKRKSEEIKCKCGNPAGPLRSCPYQEEINNNKEFVCNCCRDCVRECCEEI